MSRAVGATAERLAADYLRQKGFTLVEQNFSCQGGEIDLICDDRGTLVFVEVRSRKSGLYGAPEETIGREKKRRIIRAARYYLMVRGMDERYCRFDVVAIEGETVTYFPDAFDATGM